MNDDHRNSGQFDASLPLPDEVKIRHDDGPRVVGSSHTNPASDDSGDDNSQKSAADLIRAKINEVYEKAPPATGEINEVSQLGGASPGSAHQQFIFDLTNSGKSLPEIQVAWHEYYAGLPDGEKHQVWQEFYNAHERTSHYNQATQAAKSGPEPAPIPRIFQKRPRRGAQHIERVSKKVSSLRGEPKKGSSRRKGNSPLHSLLFGLGIGSIVMIIFLFSFFNERFIAPFIQPSRNVTNTPIITASAAPISDSPEIIIPKINVEIPVIYGVNTIDPNAVETALEDGVVHYADTADPGQDGNGVIVGHSSNNIFNPGQYKFAFVLLSRLDDGDTFYLQKNGIRYTYQVYKKSIVSPTDVSVLGPQDQPATFSLITCDPPGTSTNRLVVVGEQIDPSVASNSAASSNANSLATKTAIIPGNSPSLWSRIVGLF